MIGTQLDLFGGPPKPPKKITIDEEPEEIEKSPAPTPEERETPVLETVAEPQDVIHVQLPAENVLSFPAVIEVATETEVGQDLEPDDSNVEIEPEAEADEVEIEPKFIEEALPPQESIIIEEATVVDEIDVFEPAEKEKEEADTSTPFLETKNQLTEEVVPESAENREEDEAEVFHPVTEHIEVSNEDNQLNIPDDKILYSRQYYTMRETSAMFNVNQSLLRFWENEFDILKPKKNRKGDRYFRPEDIKNLELIYHLLRVRKFTINGAKDYLKSRSKVLDTFEMVQRLEKLKAFLVELKANL